MVMTSGETGPQLSSPTLGSVAPPGLPKPLCHRSMNWEAGCHPALGMRGCSRGSLLTSGLTVKQPGKMQAAESLSLKPLLWGKQKASLILLNVDVIFRYSAQGDQVFQAAGSRASGSKAARS